MSKSTMYDISVITDNDSPEAVTSNKFFAISLLVSLTIHIALVIYIDYQNKYCVNCNLNEHLETKPFTVRLYKEPPQPVLIEPVSIEKIVTTTKTHTPSSQQQPVTIATEPVTSKPQKLNFATLNSSIKKVISLENQKIQQTWLNDCEAVKKKTGSVDCISTNERLGLTMDDPYRLSGIFISLTNSNTSKKQQKMIAKLISEQTTIKTILKNKNLDDETRTLFGDELAYLSGELHHQDCGGSPNSGTCAGEVDLIKLASLLATVFSK